MYKEMENADQQMMNDIVMMTKARILMFYKITF